MGLVKNGPGHLVHETHLLSEFNDWADFLHADYDAVIFDYTNIALFIFDF